MLPAMNLLLVRRAKRPSENTRIQKSSDVQCYLTCTQAQNQCELYAEEFSSIDVISF